MSKQRKFVYDIDGEEFIKIKEDTLISSQKLPNFMYAAILNDKNCQRYFRIHASLKKNGFFDDFVHMKVDWSELKKILPVTEDITEMDYLCALTIELHELS